MTDTDVPEPFALSTDRVQEIRELVDKLGEPRAAHLPPLTPAEAAREMLLKLRECRVALSDLLSDRDALVKANSEAAEELALWTGSV